MLFVKKRDLLLISWSTKCCPFKYPLPHHRYYKEPSRFFYNTPNCLLLSRALQILVLGCLTTYPCLIWVTKGSQFQEKIWQSSTLLEMEWPDCLLVFVSNQQMKNLSFSTLNVRSFHGLCLLQSSLRSTFASMIPGICQVSIIILLALISFFFLVH